MDAHDAIRNSVRDAVRDLADEGRPVFLGDQALATLRRRLGRRASILSAAAVLVVVAGVLLWPQWTARHAVLAVTAPVGTTTPSTEPSVSPPQPWPRFMGLPHVPAGPTGTPAGRLVVAGYTTHPVTGDGSVDPATVATFLLDPVTGQYAQRDVDDVLAFSPDLRFALVARHLQVSDRNGDTQGGVHEYGVYDTANGRIVGRIDMDRWVPELEGRSVWNGSWSPDGRSVVLSARRAIQGGGWLADRLIFVDVSTGEASAADLAPAQGLEPQELLGWTSDSSRIAFIADRVNTDQAPSGHIAYGRDGRLISAHPWPGQRNPVRLTGSDQLLLMPMDPGEMVVMELLTGAVQHRYATAPVNSIPSWEFPLGWRDGTLIYRSQICASDRCTDGPQVLGVTPATGQSRLLHTLPEAARYLYLAPGDALTGAATQLTW